MMLRPRLRAGARPVLGTLEACGLGLAAGLWAGGEYVRVRSAPRAGAEQEAQRVLNRLDRRARALLYRPERARGADRLSDLLAWCAAPLACGLLLAALGGRHRFGRCAVRALRALFVTGALNQVVKTAAPRVRPFAMDQLEGGSGAAGSHGDRFGSFFSNHTSAVASLAGAATRIALSRRCRPAGALGFGKALAFAAPLYLLSLGVGYLRIASDRHYMTDVLAGGIFGELSGFLTA